jgi:TetR/AcrR family transcriptional regulator, regulator of autoinduction and epiphytic fitness
MVRIKVSEVNKENSTDKVDQILQGAMQEFLSHGYAGTSMDRVAASAGVSKATVYSHFGDKKGLFTSLIETLTRQRFQSVFGTEPLEGDPKTVLRELATKALEQMTNDEEYNNFKRVLIGESSRFPELAQVCVRCMTKPVLEITTTFLASHSELNIPDPEATARLMIGALVSFHMTQEIMHGKDIVPMESDRLIDALMYHITNCGK